MITKLFREWFTAHRKTLAEHKKRFSEMPLIDGYYREIHKTWGVPKLREFDRIFERIQAERDVRRLGLHRVEEALNDSNMSRADIVLFVQFLLEESKTRQQKVEQSVTPEGAAAFYELQGLEEKLTHDPDPAIAKKFEEWLEYKCRIYELLVNRNRLMGLAVHPLSGTEGVI